MITRTVDADTSQRSRRDGAGRGHDAGRERAAGRPSGRDPRRGGVGTLERPAALPGSGPALRDRQTPGSGPALRDRQAPREIRVRRAPRRAAAPAAVAARAHTSQRMPFILLLVGLLGGALVCLLVISTTLDAGAFQISSLQQQNSALATQQQELQQAVAKAKSTAVIAQRARQLGMVRAGELRFINLKTKSVATTAAPGAGGQISAPGYTP